MPSQGRLESRLTKLEGLRGGADGSLAFYLLWVGPGDDREAALAKLRTRNSIPADLPACCLEWPGKGPHPRSRVIYPSHIAAFGRRAESDAIGEALTGHLKHRPMSAADYERERAERDQFSDKTDWELIGMFITGRAKRGQLDIALPEPAAA